MKEYNNKLLTRFLHLFFYVLEVLPRCDYAKGKLGRAQQGRHIWNFHSCPQHNLCISLDLCVIWKIHSAHTPPFTHTPATRALL